MTDITRLKPYVPANYPQTAAGLPSFITDELQKLKSTFKINYEVLADLNASIVPFDPSAIEADILALQGDVTTLTSSLSGKLSASSNLSDLTSATTGRTNLGLGSSAVTSVLQVMHVQDQKASGTGGGTFTSGAWRTRDLNTATVNQITGASLASNKVTLPAGAYFVQWAAPAYLVDYHKTKLYNVTDAADIAPGAGSFTYSVSGYTQPESCGAAYFVLAGAKDIELRHYCLTTLPTSGFGLASSFGTEVYSRLTIWKLPT